MSINNDGYHDVTKVGPIPRSIYETLRDRFKTDKVYMQKYEDGVSIFVNDVCQVVTYVDNNEVIVGKYGAKTLEEHRHPLNAADPQFFQKIIDMVMQNLIF